MRLLRSHLRPDDFSIAAWETLADALRQNKGGLGDLGGGNHFLDALAPYSDDRLQLLIHTGSRAESDHVEAFVDKPVSVDAEFNRVVEWATANRISEFAIELLEGRNKRMYRDAACTVHDVCCFDSRVVKDNRIVLV